MDIVTIYKEFLESMPTLKENDVAWRGISLILLSNVTREKKQALEDIQEIGLEYCDKYEKGLDMIRAYYNKKFDLETLHDKLYKLWDNSYKQGVLFLNDNDEKIRHDILGY